MLLNFFLLLVLFGGTRWRKQPYTGALALALIKGALYFTMPLRTAPFWTCVLNGVIGFLLFGALGVGFVYFLRRLDRYEPEVATYSSPGAERVTFKWEYIPLAIVVLTLVFGELVVAFLVASPAR